jgi:phosphinothricin acetyltransferase
MIRAAGPDDIARICAIYNHYVLTTTVTFEEEPVSPDDMAQRVRDVQQAHDWLVFDGPRSGVCGYAYATRWKPRAAYRHSVETSVYVDVAEHGKGVGRALYRDLIERLRARSVHSVIGGVAGDNPVSVALHQSFGFKHVARLEQVGFKFGHWIDVNYFQLLL